MNNPSNFRDKCVGEDIGSFFGNGTQMTQIHMISADEYTLDLGMELGFEPLSNLRRSSFISVISVPS